MSDCPNCSQPPAPSNAVESQCYASIEQDQAGCLPTSSSLVSQSEEVCRPQQVSTTTDGGDATAMTNARESVAMTLLGRIGNRFAKFVGSGFIQVDNGEAKLVSYIPLKIRELFHRYVIPFPGQAAVLGEAKPAPYMVISDANGKCYAIKGLAGENCIIVWDFAAKAFLTKPVTDFPVSVKSALLKKDRIELAGFSPPSLSYYDTTREVAALKGEGIVFITNETVEYPDSACCEDENCGCGCDSNRTAALASVVPYPDDSSDKQYLLAWQFGVGPVFIEKPAASSGAPGATGATGAQGVQGIPGVQGIQGEPGEQGIQGEKGDTGAQGEAAGAANLSVVLTTVAVDRSNVVSAALTPGQDINAAGADINFETPALAELNWLHLPGAATFVLNGETYAFVEITANIIYEEGSPGGGIPIHPILDLYKNGVLVTSASSQNGHILDDVATGTVKGSNSIRYTDVGALVNGTTYKLRCRRGNGTVTPLTGVSGFFTAKAVGRTNAVVNVTLEDA